MRAEKVARGVELLILSALEPLPGRIVRDAAGKVTRIVETTDATPEELRSSEGNTGTYLVDAEFLWKALDQVDDKNAQGEIYLTDIVGIAVRDGRAIDAVPLDDADEALGINSRAELARATSVLRRRTAQRVMDEGVTLIDPDATYLDWDVSIGRDTVIEPGCVIQGPTRIGERCRIKAHTVVESSDMGDDVALGPSAHLRPGTRLGAGVRIGNFVEVKNSNLGAGVKADHLSYIGDADVGAGASFGCGSVVVNYDGVEQAPHDASPKAPSSAAMRISSRRSRSRRTPSSRPGRRSPNRFRRTPSPWLARSSGTSRDGAYAGQSRSSGKHTKGVRHMCGIVGYVGRDRLAVDVLIDGLRRLEYRGYDSAGIAVFEKGGLTTRRAVGKLARSKTC